MKTKLTGLLALAAVATLLAACSKDVSFDTLETARKQAKENADYNARTLLLGELNA